MSQLLADLSDINQWLSDHKVTADDANTASYQLTASRIVKSKLSGVFTPLILHGWSTPETTPGIIREIAGELIAAYLYRQLYAEDVTDIPEYAQNLYNEAIGLLNDIRTGNLIVLDVNDSPIAESTLQASASDFLPNASSPGPFFKVGDVWG